MSHFSLLSHPSSVSAAEVPLQVSICENIVLNNRATSIPSRLTLPSVTSDAWHHEALCTISCTRAKNTDVLSICRGTAHYWSRKLTKFTRISLGFISLQHWLVQQSDLQVLRVWDVSKHQQTRYVTLTCPCAQVVTTFRAALRTTITYIDAHAYLHPIYHHYRYCIYLPDCWDGHAITSTWIFLGTNRHSLCGIASQNIWNGP